MLNQMTDESALSLSDQLGWFAERAAGSRFAVAVFTLFAVCLATRLLSGRSPKVVEGGLRTAGLLPYWFPYVGHTLWLAILPEKLERARSTTEDGIFGLTVAGRIHNMVVKPSLVKAVFALKQSVADNHELAQYMLTSFFGNPKDMQKVHPDIIFKELHPLLNMLTKESYLETAMSIITKGIEAQVPYLVSVDKVIVEQSPWMGEANVIATPGNKESFEVDFFSLIRTWVASVASTALMGKAFMKNNPRIVQDLWEFDAGIIFFMMGLPRWMPISASRKAYASRDRLRAAHLEFVTALLHVLDGSDPWPRWKDLSDVSDIWWERCKVWRKSGHDVKIWGGGEMFIFWALNVNANALIFWLLLRIYSSSTLLSQIRSEIAPYTISSASSNQPLILNFSGIVQSCPLLKAAYYESLRLDVGSTTLKATHTDFSITESASDAFGGPPQSYLIRKGEFVHVNHSLHQNDPRYFPEPELFRPERFLFKEVQEEKGDEKQDVREVEGKEAKEKLVATQGTIRPFGGGYNYCKGAKFAEREILLYTASVLAIWDAEPVGGEWKIPEHQRASGTYLPKQDIRVKLSRRV